MSIERHYNGVHLMAGYTGTVDFQVSSFVGVLELRNGQIAQNDAFFASAGGGQLSVTQSMTWAGGEFNTGVLDSKTGVFTPPPPGKLNLLGGSVSVFDPGETDTLSLGSFVTLTNISSTGLGDGAKLDLSGSIRLEGLAGFLAEEKSFCQARAKPEARELFVPARNERVNPEGEFRVMTFKTGAELQIYRANPAARGELIYKMGKISIVTDGGAFQVAGDVKVQIEGKVSNLGDAPTILIKSGGVRIENGSSLDLTNGLKMEDGSIVTLAKMAGPGKVAATQGMITISGDVTITGGHLMMNYNLGLGGLDNTTEAVLAKYVLDGGHRRTTQLERWSACRVREHRHVRTRQY